MRRQELSAGLVLLLFAAPIMARPLIVFLESVPDLVLSAVAPAEAA